jgi:hypothetical protein
MRGTAAGVLLLCVDRVHDGGLRCVCAQPLLKTRTAFYLSGVTGDIYAYNKAERVGSPSGPAWDAASKLYFTRQCGFLLFSECALALEVVSVRMGRMDGHVLF